MAARTGRPKSGSVRTGERSRRRSAKSVTYTPEEVEALCHNYFQTCDQEGKRYTFPGLALALGITPGTLSKWAEDVEGTHEAVAETLKKALAKMSDALQQRNDNMAIFSLKQPCYGGYSDRPNEADKGALTVQVSFGAAGGEVAVRYGE